MICGAKGENVEVKNADWVAKGALMIMMQEQRSVWELNVVGYQWTQQNYSMITFQKAVNYLQAAFWRFCPKRSKNLVKNPSTPSF